MTRFSLFASFLRTRAVWFSMGFLLAFLAPHGLQAQQQPPAGPATASSPATPPASWNVNELLAAYDRSTQLMESTAILVPNLARTAEPLLETARQSVANLNRNGQHRNMVFVHRLLSNLRTYLQLLDALEKPYPMPETAGRQIIELRDLVLRFEALHFSLLESGERAILGADRDNLARYREDNQKMPAPHNRVPRVVFLGDSITDGWRLEEYFPGNDFVNRGISGQTTGQMLGRFKQDVLDLRPQAVVILAGTNDIGRQVEQGAIEDNLAMMFDLADKNRIKVIVCTLLPVSDYAQDRGQRFIQTERRPPTRIRMLNEWLKVAARTRRYRLVDYYHVMTDDDGFLKKELSDDGLHPNSEGYRAMAPHIISAIRDEVKLGR